MAGAGRGDPRLLTLRAFELLRSAEVVAHDELPSGAGKATFVVGLIRALRLRELKVAAFKCDIRSFADPGKVAYANAADLRRAKSILLTADGLL